MAIQSSLPRTGASGSSLYFEYTGTRGFSRSARRMQGAGREHTAQAAQMSSRSYASEKLLIEWNSKDGDRVSLNYERVHYQKTTASLGSENISKNDWDEIVKEMRQEFLELKQEVMRVFMEDHGGDTTGKKKVENGPEAGSALQGLPEYWNAENTSQRILEFALSFRELSESSDEEYARMIKDAIKKGFELATEEMGELPEAVGALVDNTHEMVVEKIDAWLEAREGAEEDSAVAA